MTSPLKRTWAEIDLDILATNYREIKKRIGEDVKFLGVVKADAYGHGSVRVGQCLEAEGVDYLAVCSLDEAMELRARGIKMPVMIFGHTPHEHVATLIENNFTQTVACTEKAHAYSEEAQRLGGTLKVHMKVDTGMSRLGYLCEGDFYEEGIQSLVADCQLPGLDVEGIFTHFAMSDEEGSFAKSYTDHQFESFLKVVKDAESRLGKPFRIRHCANSGATACLPDTYLDMVRPGALMYGFGALPHEYGLEPVMTLKSTIQLIKHYPKGTHVSYGGIFITERETRIGVLPYGYADGFFRPASNKVSVMTAHGLAPQIGRICMDMCMIDLTDLPEVGVHDEVEIFGKHNSIDALADASNTIPDEWVCGVSRRIPRVYIQGGKVVEHESLLRQ